MRHHDLGAFSASGRTQLALLHGYQDSAAYVDTMIDYMLTFARAHHGNNFIYQQDGAFIHTSSRTMRYVDEQEVRVLPWPSRSSDLNPIENVWAALSRVVYANCKQYSNISTLTVAVRAALEFLDEKFCCDVVQSITRMCIEVVELKGKMTHY